MTNLAVLIFLATPAFAGDWLPTLPREIVCTMKHQNGRTLVEIAGDAFRVPDFEEPSVIRQKLIDQVTTNHVEPAFRDGCADPSTNGFQILSAAREACRSGCDQEITSWPLTGRERTGQIELCKADCRAGVASAMGFAFGVKSGRGK